MAEAAQGKDKIEAYPQWNRSHWDVPLAEMESAV